MPRFAVRADGSYFDDRFASARMAINLELAADLSSDPRSIMRHELGTPSAPATRTRRTAFRRGGSSKASRATSRSARPAGAAGEPVWAAQGVDGKLPYSRTFYNGDAETVSANYARGYLVFQAAEDCVAGTRPDFHWR